jgi:hypothetical protein
VTDKLPDRLDRARKILRTITPGQDTCYVGLFGWTVYTFAFDADSPIARGMPSYIHVPYLIVTLIAPLMVFVGQYATCRRRKPAGTSPSPA